MMFWSKILSLSQKFCLLHASKRYVKANTISQNFLDSLQNIVGPENIGYSEIVKEQHGRDEGPHGILPPDVVVWPKTTKDVSEIVKYCHAHSVPIIPFGTGTGLEMGVGAPQGGVCVDLTKMDEVIDINPEDFDATVQSGVTRKTLNDHLKQTGLWFTVDPGADASIGGMASTSASGTNTVRYGTMKNNVLNMEVVLADGTVIYTAGEGRKPRKSSAGYNLTDLFVGSEGTLGIITKVIVKLHALPEKMVSAVCSFHSIKEAVDTSIEILQASIPIAKVELLDELAIEASNKYSQLHNRVAPTLFLEFHGSEQDVENQANLASEIAKSNGGSDFQWAKDQETRNKLWSARHKIFYATLALKPGTKSVVTDCCVPISKLSELIVETKKNIIESGVTGNIVGHVGDGNFHTQLLHDPNDPYQVETIHALECKISERALALGGTCTGEHGIGMGKIKFLEKEYGEDGIAVMKLLKRSLDPKNIMNPGKILLL